MSIPEQKGSPRPKSLLRRALRVIVLGGGLLFVFGGLLSIVIFLSWSYPAAMEARAELQKILKECESGSLAKKSTLLDSSEGEKDLAPHWLQVTEVFAELFREDYFKDEDEEDGDEEEDEDYYDDDAVDVLRNINRVNPANPPWGQVAAGELLLKETANQGFLKLLGQIAEMDGKIRLPADWFKPQLVYRGPNVGNTYFDPPIANIRFREAFRILGEKGRLRFCKGEIEGSVNEAFTGLSLADDFEGLPGVPPLLLPWVMSDYLQEVVSLLPHMKEETLVKFQEVLSELDFRSGLKRAVVEETLRVGYAIRRADFPLLSSLAPFEREKNIFWRFLFSLARSHHLARLYRNSNLILKAIDGSQEDLRRLAASPGFRRPRDLLKAGEPFEAFIAYYSDFLNGKSITSTWAYWDTHVEVMIAAAGVERFRRIHEKLPASLEVLSPNYLPREVRDPSTDGALKYVIGDSEYLVYSLGANGRDEGGVGSGGEYELIDDVAVRIFAGGKQGQARQGERIFASSLVLNGTNGPVLDVVFSPDGKFLVSGCYDGVIQVRDASSGKGVQSFPGHKSPVLCMAFSPGGETLLTGGGGWSRKQRSFGQLMAWDVESWKKKAVKNIRRPVTALAYSPDGASVAIGTSADWLYGDSPRGFLRRLDARTLAWEEKEMSSGSSIKAARFSPDGKKVGYLLSPRHTASPRRIARVQNGEQFVLGESCRSEELREMGLRGEYFETVSNELSASEVNQGTAGFTEMVFSPGGDLLAFGAYGCSVEIWSLEESAGPSQGKLLRSLAGHSWAVTSVAFSPDGKTLLSGSGDHTLRLWNVRDGRCLAIFEGHSLGVNSVAFSPDGKRIASASTDGSVRVWEVPSTE